MRVLSRQRGVSLIEVMMAVLIFSIGLIGMAGLLVMSTRSNQSAYLRTQVTFLARNMADRMRANPLGVWNNYYDATKYPNATTKDCQTASCTAQDLAKHDQGMWSSQLQTFLPNPNASIQCVTTSAGYTPSSDQISMSPPYGGTCHMKIQWSEQQEGDKSTRNAATQTFEWDFQP